MHTTAPTQKFSSAQTGKRYSQPLIKHTKLRRFLKSPKEVLQINYIYYAILLKIHTATQWTDEIMVIIAGALSCSIDFQKRMTLNWCSTTQTSSIVPDASKSRAGSLSYTTCKPYGRRPAHCTLILNIESPITKWYPRKGFRMRLINLHHLFVPSVNTKSSGTIWLPLALLLYTVVCTQQRTSSSGSQSTHTLNKGHKSPKRWNLQSWTAMAREN